MRVTGRQLPAKAEGLRAIYFSYRTMETPFVAFETNEEGYSHISEAFGNQDATRIEFPSGEESPLPSVRAFQTGCGIQRELGVVIFDQDLVDRVFNYAWEHPGTLAHPELAVTGWSLESSDNSAVSYQVLVLKDQGLVYVCAGKNPEGIQFR